MPPLLPPLTAREARSLSALATAPTTPTRLIQRAAAVWYATQGLRVPAIAHTVGLNESTVRLWLQRYREQGIRGLADQQRTGRPSQYDAATVRLLCTVAQTPPCQQGQPFRSWTLDRLVRYLATEHGIVISRSRLAHLLHAHAVRWHGADQAGTRLVGRA